MEERVAIVTGGSSGIGAATALMLAERGVRVALTYVGNKEGAEETAAACEAKGVEAAALQGDVSSDDDCIKVVRQAIARWGRVDVLVNNAGTTKVASMSDLSALSAEDFHRIYGVNVVGTYQMTRAAEDALRASDAGSVINTSSIAGLAGMGSSMAYAASKGALNTMTLSLARTLAPDVRVNAVCPGYVASEWWDSLADETIGKMKARSTSAALLQRVSSSEDVAEVILFLALGARSMTGQMLTADNGMTLNIGQPLVDAHR